MATEQGPFTGKGWDQESVWRKAAMQVPTTLVTKDRGNEIICTAQGLAKHGPWCDQLIRAMTQGEYRFLREVWDTLPGNASFMTALYSVVNG